MIEIQELKKLQTDAVIRSRINVSAALEKARQVIEKYHTIDTERTILNKYPKPEPKSKVARGLFLHGGVSVHKGVLKLRFTNDLEGRMKTFERDGDEEVRMITVDRPSTKQEIAQVMLEEDMFSDPEVQELIKTLL